MRLVPLNLAHVPHPGLHLGYAEVATGYNNVTPGLAPGYTELTPGLHPTYTGLRPGHAHHTPYANPGYTGLTDGCLLGMDGEHPLCSG